MRLGSSLLIDLLICLRFTTRLPLPILAFEPAPHAFAGFSRAVRMIPAAGALLGALAAGVLAMAASIGLPPLIAAPLAIGALLLLSGALHEDGLADCADGFGGGSSAERKLEIMRDSRIGAFGALALALALYLRVASLTVMAGHKLALAGAVLIGAAALSRAAALIPQALLPPARNDGAGFCAGKPEPEALAAAACLAILFALTPIIAGAGLGKALAGAAAGIGAALAFTALAKRQIGGQTGDVAGGAQQLSEIAFYLVFAAGN
ncbi:adenosylcobinamide-GDP ribazoletransferase [Methylocapsa aurea]|uniref:adenosylcobinamide-GDP ribazoletransferase n=1 Tax=Methylocapsa aurea TaxID=663610 RepID=UPI00055A0775|nr:adenosylcobinamide-GDP ribazoletransferase [Methylocapsa aurea]